MDPLLHRLRSDTEPSAEARARVRARLQGRMRGDAMLRRATSALQPQMQQKEQGWSHVLRRIESPISSGILSDLRLLLQPAPAQRSRVQRLIVPRIVPRHVSTSYRLTKWTAAFAVVVVVLRVSPVLFLAPQTNADSSVILLPTRGTVETLAHGLWQSIGETELMPGTQVRTGDAEATIILHDDGTIRLDAHTTVTVLDTHNRPEAGSTGPTILLQEGRVWVQGLLPAGLSGMTVATSDAQITVNDGSASVEYRDGRTSASVWDRRAVLFTDATRVVIVVGEYATVDAGVPRVRRTDAALLDDTWVTQNLQRDAVHQREIAQLQRERRAAQAGILPTSPLYPVKRVAERFDVLLTIDPDVRAQKKVQQASTRLSEAAALIAEGQSGSTLLEEYRDTLLAVAAGSGEGLSRFFAQQEVTENVAELAAALPDDELYALKKAVLETSADLSSLDTDRRVIETTLLSDSLDLLHRQITEGDADAARQTYDTLRPVLDAIDSEESEVAPETRKEILTALQDAAKTVSAADKTGTGARLLAQDLSPYLPRALAPARVGMSEEEVAALVDQMYERIFVYSQARPRWNQLQIEIEALHGNPDEGTILRHLYHALPRDGLARYVRTAIQELRESKQGD